MSFSSTVELTLQPRTSSHESLVGTGNKDYLINGKIYNSKQYCWVVTITGIFRKLA